MTVINTNNAATLTANALTKNERAMSQAMERLSTGVRINSAGDDAAGLAISSRMTSQINGRTYAGAIMMISISMIRMISNDDARQSSQTEVKEDFSLHAVAVPGLHNGQAARPSHPSDLAAAATSVTEAREGEKGTAFPLRAPRADTARERGASASTNATGLL